MKAVYLALEAVSTALLVHKFLCLDQNRGKGPMGLNLPGNAVAKYMLKNIKTNLA